MAPTATPLNSSASRPPSCAATSTSTSVTSTSTSGTEEDITMTEGGTELPSWSDQMRALDRVGDNLMAAWRPDGATVAEAQDMYKLALSILATGYLCRVYTDAS